MKEKKKIIKPKIDLVELSKSIVQFRLELTELHKAIRNSLVELAVNVDKNIKNIQELSKTVVPHTDSLKSLSARLSLIEQYKFDKIKKELEKRSVKNGKR